MGVQTRSPAPSPRRYTIGRSQSAAFLHGFIFWGFNEEGHDNSAHDQKGRIVFDGAWPQIDGRMMVMNIRWGQPNNLMYLVHGRRRSPGLVGGLSEPGP